VKVVHIDSKYCVALTFSVWNMYLEEKDARIYGQFLQKTFLLYKLFTKNRGGRLVVRWRKKSNTLKLPLILSQIFYSIFFLFSRPTISDVLVKDAKSQIRGLNFVFCTRHHKPIATALPHALNCERNKWTTQEGRNKLLEGCLTSQRGWSIFYRTFLILGGFHSRFSTDHLEPLIKYFPGTTNRVLSQMTFIIVEIGLNINK